MERAQSPYTVTYDPAGTPLVLVTAGQFVDGDFRIPWRANIQGSVPVGAAGGKFYNRKGITREIVFGVYKDHDSFAEATNYLLQVQVDLPNVINALCRFAVPGGYTFQIDAATLSMGDSMLVRKTAGFRSWVQWRIQGGDLVRL